MQDDRLKPLTNAGYSVRQVKKFEAMLPPEVFDGMKGKTPREAVAALNEALAAVKAPPEPLSPDEIE